MEQFREKFNYFVNRVDSELVILAWSVQHDPPTAAESVRNDR